MGEFSEPVQWVKRRHRTLLYDSIHTKLCKGRAASEASRNWEEGRPGQGQTGTSREVVIYNCDVQAATPVRNSTHLIVSQLYTKKVLMLYCWVFKSKEKKERPILLLYQWTSHHKLQNIASSLCPLLVSGVFIFWKISYLSGSMQCKPREGMYSFMTHAPDFLVLNSAHVKDFNSIITCYLKRFVLLRNENIDQPED